MGPKTIVPRKGRQYANGAEWKGAGFNGINGEPENGLEGYLFERFIGVEASKAKAGGVLDPHKKKTMTLDMRKVFEKNMITLQESIAKEESPDKMASLTAAFRNAQAVMETADKLIHEYNQQAQVVIDLIKKHSAHEVGQLFEPIELRLGTNTEQILEEFLGMFRERFLGRPSDVRAQLNKRLAAIGVAHNREQLQLLLAEIRYWADIAFRALMEENPEDTAEVRAKVLEGARARARAAAMAAAVRGGGKEGDEIEFEFDEESVEYPPKYIRKDEDVAVFTDRELLDVFLARLDDTAMVLGPYKELAIAEKARRFTSDYQFERAAAERLDNDVPTLLSMAATAQAHAALHMGTFLAEEGNGDTEQGRRRRGYPT